MQHRLEMNWKKFQTLASLKVLSTTLKFVSKTKIKNYGLSNK